MVGTTEIIWVLLVIILFILIMTRVYKFIKHQINRNKTSGYEGKSALDIAKERYAKGEITKEELEEIKRI